jgi:hypothetical protein
MQTHELLRPRLPTWLEDYKVIIDLDEGLLHIRIVPGGIHGFATGAYQYAFEAWSRNLGPLNPGAVPPLRKRSDTSNPSTYSLADACRLQILRTCFKITRPVLCPKRHCLPPDDT